MKNPLMGMVEYFGNKKDEITVRVLRSNAYDVTKIDELQDIIGDVIEKFDKEIANNFRALVDKFDLMINEAVANGSGYINEA